MCQVYQPSQTHKLADSPSCGTPLKEKVFQAHFSPCVLALPLSLIVPFFTVRWRHRNSQFYFLLLDSAQVKIAINYKDNIAEMAEKNQPTQCSKDELGFQEPDSGFESLINSSFNKKRKFKAELSKMMRSPMTRHRQFLLTDSEPANSAQVITNLTSWG